MEDFDNTIIKLERMSSTHPQLSTLWKNYLCIKKTHFEQQLILCNNIFSMIEQDTIDNIDIPLPTLLLLYFIYNQ